MYEMSQMTTINYAVLGNYSRFCLFYFRHFIQNLTWVVGTFLYEEAMIVKSAFCRLLLKYGTLIVWRSLKKCCWGISALKNLLRYNCGLYFCLCTVARPNRIRTRTFQLHPLHKWFSGVLSTTVKDETWIEEIEENVSLLWK